MRLKLPVTDRSQMEKLTAGQELELEGTLYTARDRIHYLTASGEAEWPFDLENNGIFYCGPTGSRNGFPMGSCGPTTSYRMDRYAPSLYDRGLALTIGKGGRGPEVIEAVRRNRGLYLLAYGGCGALYGSRIEKAEVVAFKELGPQAVYMIEVRDFPVIVGIDSRGKDIFEQ